MNWRRYSLAIASPSRRHGIVRSEGIRFRFDHHLIQEVLYEGIPQLLRQDYHATLADVLQQREMADAQEIDAADGATCVKLCEHYLKGARGEDALPYLEPATTHLTKAYLNAQAAALTERALALPARPTRRT